jgi:hypothetical protein
MFARVKTIPAPINHHLASLSPPAEGRKETRRNPLQVRREEFQKSRNGPVPREARSLLIPSSKRELPTKHDERSDPNARPVRRS